MAELCHYLYQNGLYHLTFVDLLLHDLNIWQDKTNASRKKFLLSVWVLRELYFKSNKSAKNNKRKTNYKLRSGLLSGLILRDNILNNLARF